MGNLFDNSAELDTRDALNEFVVEMLRNWKA